MASIISELEDDTSETYVNGVNLYAVEYVAGDDIKEVFVDVNGEPHTYVIGSHQNLL